MLFSATPGLIDFFCSCRYYYYGQQLDHTQFSQTMNPAPAAAPSPQPWIQPMLPPNPPPSSAFWDTKTVQNLLRELQDTLTLAKAMRREVELLMAIKDTEEPLDSNSRAFSKYLEDRGIDLKTQESVSLEAANSLMSRLRAQLEPFMSIVDETIPWEEKSAAVWLADKVLKSKRNKLWRQRRRRRIVEMKTKVVVSFLFFFFWVSIALGLQFGFA
ncbi:hypothetical protein Tsubulata_039224 [Turnera subulata]|uniref:Uncharacterized protein n=1 Tax=Turnera subulata TaxID=218843 RepID=A0A9Q0F2U5_9ROSI|nr:hypothetical protein Tsubulata_039224 [Turnera subulata]